MMYLMDETLSFKLEMIPVKSGLMLEDDSICFSAHPNTHIKRRYQSRSDISVPTDSFSYSVTMPDKRRIVYTGDIGDVHDLDALVDGTDLLLAELAHVEPQDLLAYLAGKKVGKIVCLHIHPVWNDREKDILALSKQIFGKEIVIGQDGIKIVF